MQSLKWLWGNQTVKGYPITIEILKNLLLNVRYISHNSYEIVLFKAMCVLAFFLFFEDWRNSN